MRYFFTISLVLMSFILFSQGNNFDSSYKFLIKNKSYNLNYGKIKDADDFSKRKLKNYPVYVLDKQDFIDLKYVLNYFSNKSIVWDSLMKVYAFSDSICNRRENILNEIIVKEEKRVDLYRDSYNDVVLINTQLSNQLNNCTNLAKEASRHSSLNGVLYGILGGMVTGIVIGVVVGH